MRPPPVSIVKDKRASSIASATLASTDENLSVAARQEEGKRLELKRSLEVKIAPIKEHEQDDSDEESLKKAKVKHVQVERRLEELNQTMALLKRVKPESDVKDKLEKFGIDKDYVEDTTEDRKHLIQYKNLPSIRDRLLSIKSKQ